MRRPETAFVRSNPLPQVYTPEQVAEVLKIGRSKVYELVTTGGLSVKIGRLRRLPQRAIEESLEDRAP
jgi:excisionase family DNA binding protein